MDFSRIAVSFLCEIIWGVFGGRFFGEIQTISLDHYRLDEFEKMFILNYQKLSEAELKVDTNFQLAYHALLNSNSSLAEAALIGVAQKPLGLGYIYHIFQRVQRGIIVLL